MKTATSEQLSPDKNSEIVTKTSLLQRFGVLLFILFCIAGALTISRTFLIHNSLRLDEAQSLWQASHSISGTLKVVAQDVHVPLYHLILHFWILYVGNSIETARTLSMIFFLLTIPAVYLLDSHPI